MRTFAFSEHMSLDRSGLSADELIVLADLNLASIATNGFSDDVSSDGQRFLGIALPRQSVTLKACAHFQLIRLPSILKLSVSHPVP
jgi:hypothetical protein